jgi:hypothetical protein
MEVMDNLSVPQLSDYAINTQNQIVALLFPVDVADYQGTSLALNACTLMTFRLHVLEILRRKQPELAELHVFRDVIVPVLPGCRVHVFAVLQHFQHVC